MGDLKEKSRFAVMMVICCWLDIWLQ